MFKTIIIILILTIKSIFTSSEKYESFNYYSSIKTNHSILILNSSFFNRSDSIYLSLNSKDKCENYLGFQFFDDYNSISNLTLESKLYISATYKSDNNYIEGKKYFIFNWNERRFFIFRI